MSNNSAAPNSIRSAQTAIEALFMGLSDHKQYELAGRYDEAIRVLQRLGHRANISDTLAEVEAIR